MSEGDMNNDQKILALLASDDERSMDLLFSVYYRTILDIVSKVMLDKVIAKDIVQELFFNIWDKRHKLNITRPILHYLNRAAVNRCLNYKRDGLNSMEILSGDLRKYEKNYLDLPASSAMETAELESIIQLAIEHMPPRARAMFLLSREEGKTYREIAVILGVSEKAVERRMTGALQYLTVFLKPYLKTILLSGWIYFDGG